MFIWILLLCSKASFFTPAHGKTTHRGCSSEHTIVSLPVNTNGKRCFGVHDVACSPVNAKFGYGSQPRVIQRTQLMMIKHPYDKILTPSLGIL